MKEEEEEEEEIESSITNYDIGRNYMHGLA